MKAIRWSDNDRYFGRFTYAHEPNYRKVAVMLGSGDDDEYSGCRLRLALGAHTLIVALPRVLKPYKRWIDTTRREDNRPVRVGGYWDMHEREYGFTLYAADAHFHFGAQTHSSETSKNKVWFYPWRSMRHIRRSFYDLEGQHVATLPEWKGGYRSNPHRWTVEQAIEATCPTAQFLFTDFDGEQLTATTKIEEREWRRGEGKFKWLSLFSRPHIRRSLDVRFSGETGRRKGSWKGGTVGSSIDLQPGELHEAAFRRYCAEHDMKFVGPVPAPQAADHAGFAMDPPGASK